MKAQKKNRVVVYDRNKFRETISRHRTWELAERAAEKMGGGDRFGLKEEYDDRPHCPKR